LITSIGQQFKCRVSFQSHLVLLDLPNGIL
jgi:hypothetical protein